MRHALVAALALTLTLTVHVPPAAAATCRDFAYQEDAQAFYAAGGADNLDRDRDGIACEDLPERGSVTVTSASTPVEGSNAVCDEARIRDYNGMSSETSNVNLRTGASTASRVITVLQPGTLVRIHSWRTLSDGRWAWLTTEQGQDGWARHPYVDCIRAFGY